MSVKEKTKENVCESTRERERNRARAHERKREKNRRPEEEREMEKDIETESERKRKRREANLQHVLTSVWDIRSLPLTPVHFGSTMC